jgi:hypothetical protein
MSAPYTKESMLVLPWPVAQKRGAHLVTEWHLSTCAALDTPKLRELDHCVAQMTNAPDVTIAVTHGTRLTLVFTWMTYNGDALSRTAVTLRALSDRIAIDTIQGIPAHLWPFLRHAPPSTDLAS